MSVLDKVRRWIDGETAELVLEQAARDAQVKPRSKAEEFIVKIARMVESVMQNEMVPLPQGTTIIPSEYIIFLSSDDDKEWQGVKRRGLEQGLYHILAERAREIAGKKKLETKSFVIELRVDATLEKGQVRVQHSWEDANNKTGVLARPKALPQVAKDEPKPQVKPQPQPLPHVTRSAQATNPNMRLPADQADKI
ncbi:MAG: FhaA domain-containing protein, partial [Pyrinomonadaceae bacterium]